MLKGGVMNGQQISGSSHVQLILELLDLLKRLTVNLKYQIILTKCNSIKLKEGVCILCQNSLIK